VQNQKGKGTAAVTGTGLAAGLAAIVASSCCVLPIVFVGLGLGSVAAVLIPTLAVLRPYLLGAAVLTILAAWVIYARRRQACASDAACGTVGSARRAPIWLVLASAIVLLALIWQPWIEPLLLRWIR
jgi:mercuric ion transport protein